MWKLLSEKGAGFFEIWPWQLKKKASEGQVLFEDGYRKNARLLSEIRLRSFRSNSEGGGSCFRLVEEGGIAALDEEEGV